MMNLEYILKSIRYTFKNNWVFKYIGISTLIHIFLFILTLCITSTLSVTLFSFLNEQTKLNINGNVLSVFSGVLGVLLGGVIIYYVYRFFSSLINQIVYVQMIPRIYKEVYKEELPHRTFTEDFIASLKYEFKKLIVILLIAILSFFLNLIPGIGNALYIALNFFQIIVITGLDSFEPSLIKLNLRFRDKLKEIVKRPRELWVFLLVIGFLGNIPIVNILLIPINIIASTFVAKEVLLNENRRA